MARGVHDIERYILYLDHVAVVDAHGDPVDLRLPAHHGDAAGGVPERAQAGDVVGVDMGVDGLDQRQVQLLQQFQVTVHLFDDGVDDQRFTTGTAGQQIGIGARNAVE